jgi:hypothetical protein
VDLIWFGAESFDDVVRIWQGSNVMNMEADGRRDAPQPERVGLDDVYRIH